VSTNFTTPAFCNFQNFISEISKLILKNTAFFKASAKIKPFLKRCKDFQQKKQTYFKNLKFWG